MPHCALGAAGVAVIGLAAIRQTSNLFPEPKLRAVSALAVHTRRHKGPTDLQSMDRDAEVVPVVSESRRSTF